MTKSEEEELEKIYAGIDDLKIRAFYFTVENMSKLGVAYTTLDRKLTAEEKEELMHWYAEGNCLTTDEIMFMVAGMVENDDSWEDSITVISNLQMPMIASCIAAVKFHQMNNAKNN